MSLSLRFKILLKVLSLEGEKGFAQNACLKSILKKKETPKCNLRPTMKLDTLASSTVVRTESALQIRSNKTKNVLAVY